MRMMRDAYELPELAEVWGMSDADIRSLVGRGILELCVRVVAQPAVHHERTCREEGAASWATVDVGKFSGLADLALQDAFRLVRDGEGVVSDVFPSPDTRISLHDGAGLLFRADDLLVRRDHAEHLQCDVIGIPPAEKDAFDFRLFVYDETEFAFTLPQARALEFMVEKTRAGAPDQHYTDILDAVGSASQRLSSLFSRKPCWRRLLRKTPGRRGWYHLDPDFVIWLLTSP